MRSPAAIVLLAAVLSPLASAALAAAPRASLTEIENEVMCVSCREPLSVAQSPQAFAERDFVRRLVDQGQTKPQIEQALVASTAPRCSAARRPDGFNLTVYILPPALVVIGLLDARRHAPPLAPARPGGSGEPRSRRALGLSPADARRLEEDLRRYD